MASIAGYARPWGQGALVLAGHLPGDGAADGLRRRRSFSDRSLVSAQEPPQDVPLGGGSIRLGQFLKLAGILSGGEAKEAVAEGLVTVNGEVDLRRGRQLAVGDVVGVDRNRFRVSE
ncbi:hypothetical protein C5C00_11160 [Rathayibacter rathayi]|nr:hypothetical protein C5C47_10740 [Rathayibacter rathayi]PPG95010.1 hypothetical protein C5C00_11160 [Rathayibacter rathayi]